MVGEVLSPRRLILLDRIGQLLAQPPQRGHRVGWSARATGIDLRVLHGRQDVANGVTGDRITGAHRRFEVLFETLAHRRFGHQDLPVIVADSPIPGSPEPGLKLPSAEQVKMEMRHRLPGIRAIVRDHPVAAVVEPVLGGDTRS